MKFHELATFNAGHVGALSDCRSLRQGQEQNAARLLGKLLQPAGYGGLVEDLLIDVVQQMGIVFVYLNELEIHGVGEGISQAPSLVAEALLENRFCFEPTPAGSFSIAGQLHPAARARMLGSLQGMGT